MSSTPASNLTVGYRGIRIIFLRATPEGSSQLDLRLELKSSES